MKKLLTKFKKDQRGLTLVELLAVVVILAIVSAIAFVIIGNVINNSKKDAQVSNAQQIINAVKVSEASGDVKQSALESDAGVDALKLDTVGKPVDPWDKKAYTTATVKKSTAGVYSITLAPDGKCKISGVTEPDLQEGRDKACGKE